MLKFWPLIWRPDESETLTAELDAISAASRALRVREAWRHCGCRPRVSQRLRACASSPWIRKCRELSQYRNWFFLEPPKGVFRLRADADRVSLADPEKRSPA